MKAVKVWRARKKQESMFKKRYKTFMQNYKFSKNPSLIHNSNLKAAKVKPLSKQDVENTNFKLTKYFYSLKLERKQILFEARKTRNVMCRVTTPFLQSQSWLQLQCQNNLLKCLKDQRVPFEQQVQTMLTLHSSLNFHLRLQLFLSGKVPNIFINLND